MAVAAVAVAAIYRSPSSGGLGNPVFRIASTKGADKAAGELDVVFEEVGPETELP